MRPLLQVGTARNLGRVVIAQQAARAEQPNRHAAAGAQGILGGLVFALDAERSRQQAQDGGLAWILGAWPILAHCGVAPGGKRALQLKNQGFHDVQSAMKSAIAARLPVPASTSSSQRASAQAP